MINWLKLKIAKCLIMRDDIIVEICSRIIIIVIFVITDYAAPFKRKIQPEEVWLYRFPHSEDFIPFKSLQIFIIAFAIMIIWGIYQHNKNVQDAGSAILGITLSMYLSTTVTNFIKLVVGRPRPDFFERCFEQPPEDINDLAEAKCDRDDEIVDQGYKSFPSGHATIAFSGMLYMSLYIAHTLKVFAQRHSRYSSIRLCATILPVVVAVLVAASRTADYHHHWQDVLVGSLIGLVFAYMCFRQSFHGPLHKSPHLPVLHASPPLKSPPPMAEVHLY
ncbi:phosphatidate phosphatase ppapdc1a [Plakobranchus ocellatus]|uniref:Phosphatidate phosphatase ppapdc1a n=1 Tax=Plakobranchus ocellatus TaxID=259542 RepID=A0AAV4D1Q2_9GAST|nr:phosphatidate phosphatase ppapdc1a [Plakobranchus ocellatus]